MAAVDIGTPIKREQSALADSPACPTPLSKSFDNHGTPGSASNVRMNSTPSPSTSTASNGQPSQSRRPPRKSTLTQQQKNQKRQRATQDQLGTLEMEFNKNPTPTAQVRDRIAEEIDMTERSVQIWFQNRRAKIKLMAKKSLETGEDFDCIPESMRNYLAMQAMEAGKGLGGQYLGRTGLLPYSPSMLMGNEQNGKVLIHHLSSRSLNIGKWTRVSQSTMDLIIFYSPDKCTMTYYINNDQAGYKIEYPFAYIKNMYLENQEGDPSKPSGIVIELNRPPHFFMDQTPATSGFFQCGDFTEEQQASNCLVHHLGGNPKVLSGQLAKLVSLDAFMNRNNPNPFFENHSLSVSAPVSPTARPSSQPNFAQPHVGMFQESWGISHLQPGMRGPGHKRQRSRSVPMAVDFSMLQTPMPSFYIQQPGEAAPQPHNPNIFAPVPQQPSGLGPNLRIDTQAGFGMDMRQYPMSATTASPSEFASPGYFAGPEPSPLPTSSYNTPYGGAFLSPMANHSNMVPPPHSPLSFNGHGEPSIVEQSPPLSMLGRPASADIYRHHGGGDASCAVSEDGGSLNEMYSKHTINLPMHPHSPSHVDQAQAELDMNQLVQFDHVDPSSLSPDSMHHIQQQ
ncbi:Pyriculol/pyriculariol biosynthesis cluster transcription factor like protein [Verticillium longisporum]|uniref:Pyriculol/pyriculariol biosynthesis cluster transcription factor like protein n=1 Tax=Verticillium longisporum TaxID=100787 RepID=A0A8I3AWH3_VERLO|nr:Pyriculol/pyriculariol biosynthesis cluster transcription factor like protein [Verticillium longisporum]KAG7142079.1 Pyriculol/pyriculariol biosynthesis cluster transcription factor like protein [Verticillium longisporum]